jgi:hypothetical protein
LSAIVSPSCCAAIVDEKANSTDTHNALIFIAHQY